MSKDITTKSLSIRKLNSLFDKRIFAVPKLQREFVWDGKKAAQLMDSIYRGYPIGSILIWRTKKRNQFKLNHQIRALPSYDDLHNNEIYFIIDGQQRLSVIYRMMRGDAILNSNNKEVDFGKVYYSLDGEDEKLFRYAKRPDFDYEVKLSDILSHRWNYVYRDYYKYEFNSIKNCRKNILDYRLNFTFIEGFKLDEVKYSFVRINSLGTPLSAADQAFTFASSFNLRNLINTARNDFAYGFNQIPRITLLRTIALIWGSNQFSQTEINKISEKIEKSKAEQKRFNQIWKKLKHSYGLAIDFMVKTFDMYHYSFLPSQNIVTVLAAFFYFNRNTQPNAFQKKQIRKWFWYTAVGSRYSGRGYFTNIQEDFRFFKRLGTNKNAHYKIKEKLNVVSIKYSDYSRKSSITDAFLCMLSSKKPKFLDGGDPIPLDHYSTIANKKNRHHIFPRAHLRRKGFSQTYYNSIGNICYLVSKENIEVGAKAPYKYLEPFKKRKYFKGVLRSHLIPMRKEYGLWDANTKRSFKKFLSRRTQLICNAFEKLAGTKLFEN